MKKKRTIDFIYIALCFVLSFFLTITILLFRNQELTNAFTSQKKNTQAIYFDQANQHYQNRLYLSAKNIYQDLLNINHDSIKNNILNYNLGNSYYRLYLEHQKEYSNFINEVNIKDLKSEEYLDTILKKSYQAIAKSIYHYYIAYFQSLIFTKLSNNIQHNITHVNLVLKELFPQIAINIPFYFKFIDLIAIIIFIIGLLLMILASSIFFLFYINKGQKLKNVFNLNEAKKRKQFRISLILFTVAIIFQITFFSIQSVQKNNIENYLILLNKTPIYSEPNEESLLIIDLYPSSGLYGTGLIDGEWIEIVLKDNSRGWVNRENILSLKDKIWK